MERSKLLGDGAAERIFARPQGGDGGAPDATRHIEDRVVVEVLVLGRDDGRCESWRRQGPATMLRQDRGDTCSGVADAGQRRQEDRRGGEHNEGQDHRTEQRAEPSMSPRPTRQAADETPLKAA